MTNVLGYFDEANACLSTFCVSPILLGLFFLVAFLYASVGHGGASGYLALMALWNFTPKTMIPIALVLNIVVASIAWWQYTRRGYFSWRLTKPLVLSALPFTFLGALIPIEPHLYYRLLALLLVYSSGRLFFCTPAPVFFSSNNPSAPSGSPSVKKLALIGSSIGLLSGLLGIGGGIFLSPLLIFWKWASPKETAGISACFIVTNASIGLLSRQMGQSLDGPPLPSLVPLLTVGILGSLLGSYLGSRHFSNTWIQWTLGAALVIAALKLWFFS